MLSEAFWTPTIASSQFDEYSQLGSRTNIRPVKNGLKDSTVQYLYGSDVLVLTGELQDSRFETVPYSPPIR